MRHSKLEQAARQAQIAISDAVNALLFLARDCEMRNSAIDTGNKAITAMREALEQLNCQCGDKCFPVFSGDIEYCETCGKLTALTEQAEQEPVAWILTEADGTMDFDCQPTIKPTQNDYDALREGETFTPLYAAPVRTKDLTDDEIRAVWLKVIDPDGGDEVMALARAVIAADREKNK